MSVPLTGAGFSASVPPDPIITAAILALNPELLFAAGEPGSCFQERTGASATTPCAIGDPVGSLKNWGSLGGWLAAPSDAARPLLQQTAGGKRYLAYDGTDDALQGALAALRNTAGWTLGATVRNEGSSASVRVVLQISAATNTSRANLNFLITTQLLTISARRANADTAVNVSGATHNSADAVAVAIGDYTNTDGFIRANAAQEGTSASWLTAGVTPSDFGDVALGCFKNGGAQANFFQGPISAAFGSLTVLAGADLTTLETWLAAQAVS